MFRNYFKSAWRNLIKSRLYSTINIVGLATGMAVAMLIGLWIWDEVSFDSYHQNREQIAKVKYQGHVNNEKWTNDYIMMPLANELRQKFGSDFKYISLVAGEDDHVIGLGEKKITAHGPWVEQDFPRMFTLDMKEGNKDALKDPSAALISVSVAKALFGNAPALGQVIKLDNSFTMKIGGVYEDLPRNTTFFNTKILLSWTNEKNWFNTKNPMENWDNHCGWLFVQVADHTNMSRVSAKIKNVYSSHIKEVTEEAFLHPLSEMHLHNLFKDGQNIGGRIQFVRLFGYIGAFVLLLACINFMNLSTARSEKRAKEVGIRKTIGSLRRQIIWQFLSESVMISFVALILAIGMVLLSLSYFNELANKNMQIPWTNSFFFLMIIVFTLFTGLIAGSYPALYLSSFRPIKVLKGVFRAGRFASLPRRVLVVLQFTVSIVLIIGTFIVYRQIQFAKNRPVGYSRAGLININMNTPDIYQHSESIRTELLQSGVVEDVSMSNGGTTQISSWNGGFHWKGMDEKQIAGFGTISVNEDFGHTIGWKIIEGRDFSRNFHGDSLSLLINEAAAKVMHMQHPVGEIISYQGNIFPNRNLTIVGLVKDMVMESPYDSAQACFFFVGGNYNTMIIRMSRNMPAKQSLTKIEAVFKRYNPGGPFDFRFVDDLYASKFAEEERIGNLSTVFAVLAIFISCLGMFGLASFVAEQRTKEIGMRKVLGASVFNLWKLMSLDFVALVIISCVIASPIAWYYLNDWLQRYFYRTGISWWIFTGAGVGALLITLLTVSFQAIKAALMNPTKALRSE